MRPMGVHFAFVVWLLTSLGPAVMADEVRSLAAWSQWRGPHRNGRITATPWPNRLDDERLKLNWEIPLEPSYSGPIVTADRVFVTETKDRKLEVVRALDRSTGELLWEKSWEGSLSVPFFAKANGDWIRATPAYDGERLYVAGIRDLLVCLDAATGAEVWRVDFVAQTAAPVPAFGFVSSPLIVGEAVYVQAGASLAKLDKHTGQILWQVLKDEGGMNGSAFSSPLLAEIEGKSQLLVQTREQLVGVDPGEGQVLWSQTIPAFRGMNILTPTVVGSDIFTSSYGGRSILLRVANREDTWSIEQSWDHKAQGYMSSPVVIDGHIYLHLRNQRFTCIDLQTGTERWTTTPFGKYWSLVANGNRILALDERGELLLIDANPKEFTLLDQRTVATDSWAHLAVSGSQIFVRDLTGLKVFDWQ